MNPQQMQQLQQAQMMAAQLQAGQQMQAAQMGGNPMMAQQQQAMMAQQQQAAMAQQQQAMMAQQQQAAGGGMGGMGGMPAAQPTMAQPVQASVAPNMGAPMGASSASVKITLPDGSVITKEALSIIFTGPTKQTMSISPVPQWQVGAGNASGGGKMITEKTAVCLKMSNQKMPVTGFTRWQERHITLNALRLSWATSAGGAERNHIDIDAGFNIYKAESESPRYKDAYRKEDQVSMTSMLTQPIGNMLSETSGTVGKDFVLAIRKPLKQMDMIDSVMGTLNESSAIGLAFGGASKLQKGVDENSSRTYYFAFKSAAERDDFHDALVNNLNAYMGTPAFMEDVQAPFKNGLRRVGANVDAIDLCPFLDELYSQQTNPGKHTPKVLEVPGVHVSPCSFNQGSSSAHSPLLG